jgi:hypothetical protein
VKLVMTLFVRNEEDILERAALVSGDEHLLALAGRIPIYSPREFVDLV